MHKVLSNRMTLKLKTRPEDFVVQELVSLPFSDKGLYGVYILKKRGWNTADAVLRIAHALRIPLRDIAYGGRKDRHAVTSQYVTIKGTRRHSIQEKQYSLEWAGFSESPMSPEFITGNRFAVTVRQLKPERVTAGAAALERIKHSGFPNYFDDQRFGSYDKNQGFFAEKILKGHLNGALKQYLTAIHPEDKRPEKDRKRFFTDHWKDWETCLGATATRFERDAFEHLRSHSKSFLQPLSQIPREEVSLFYAAFQSFLWNEVLRRLITAHCAAGSAHISKGVCGDFIFFQPNDIKAAAYFAKTFIPMPGPSAKAADDVKAEYRAVLEEYGITSSMFSKACLPQAFFKSFPRPAVVKAADLKWTFEDDDLYPGTCKANTGFTLPRGSYATMLLKAAFDAQQDN